jgi:hypothetical protein
LANGNLNGATSRRYANSTINHIYLSQTIERVFQGRAVRLRQFSGQLL